MNLILIPARGGSKGVPDKNIKKLGNQPLIKYAIDIAQRCFPDDLICISTDSLRIKTVVEDLGVQVPFLRPSELATDNATTDDVITHAINYYTEKGVQFKNVILLQPTSPFRQEYQLKEAYTLFEKHNPNILVSVCETDVNPYYNLFEENEFGYLIKSKESDITRRQDLPRVYELNGAIYIFDVNVFLRTGSLSGLSKKMKYVMSKETSVDIDTPLDWNWCEFLIKNNGFAI